MVKKLRLITLVVFFEDVFNKNNDLSALKLSQPLIDKLIPVRFKMQYRVKYCRNLVLEIYIYRVCLMYFPQNIAVTVKTGMLWYQHFKEYMHVWVFCLSKWLRTMLTRLQK